MNKKVCLVALSGALLISTPQAHGMFLWKKAKSIFTRSTNMTPEPPVQKCTVSPNFISLRASLLFDNKQSQQQSTQQNVPQTNALATYYDLQKDIQTQLLLEKWSHIIAMAHPIKVTLPREVIMDNQNMPLLPYTNPKDTIIKNYTKKISSLKKLFALFMRNNNTNQQTTQNNINDVVIPSWLFASHKQHSKHHAPQIIHQWPTIRSGKLNVEYSPDTRAEILTLGAINVPSTNYSLTEYRNKLESERDEIARLSAIKLPTAHKKNVCWVKSIKQAPIQWPTIHSHKVDVIV
jgi:hypothetical protein